MKRSPIRRITSKQARRQREWREVTRNLAENKNWCCEICKRHIGFIGKYGLSGHHIFGRGERFNQEWNCLIVCEECHIGKIHGRDGHAFDLKLKREAQTRLREAGMSDQGIREYTKGKLYI